MVSGYSGTVAVDITRHNKQHVVGCARGSRQQAAQIRIMGKGCGKVRHAETASGKQSFM